MASRNAADAGGLDVKALDEQINEAYRALFTLRFQHASRQLENYRELRNAKRNIARLRTIKRERQIAALVQGE